ncbi:MAG: hypothetical protein L0229_00725 [Blastocatellia bacterium]|nr:hypothetical protein [Blastocatellia bacterium]
MKPILTFSLLLIVAAGMVAGEQQDGPLNKKDILGLLKATAGGRITEGDLASQVESRGISFQVDETTIDELQKAGATLFLLSVIRRAGEAAIDPRLLRPSEADESKEEDEESSLIEQARAHAIEYLQDLPDFIVLQTIKRYARSNPNLPWRLGDTLEVELTYSAGKGETFKVVRVNGKPSDKDYEDLGGASSTGEFGSRLAGILMPQAKASFKEAGRRKFRGRSVVIYNFKVETVNSRSQITDINTGRAIMSGSSGSIWIDVETRRAVRIEQSHDAIPANFPITLAETVLEYDWIKVREDRYLMPVRAEVILGRTRDGFYTRNVIEFKDYRKFDTSIRLAPDNEQPRKP